MLHLKSILKEESFMQSMTPYSSGRSFNVSRGNQSDGRTTDREISAPPPSPNISPPRSPRMSSNFSSAALTHTVDAIAIRRFFESAVGHMKEGRRDPIDVALFHLHAMGMGLVTYWDEPGRGMGEFEAQKLALEQQALPTLINKVYQQEKVGDIESPKKQAEMAFMEEVTRLLNDKLFLNLKEPVDSDFNRKMLVLWNGKSEQIFRQMEFLGRVNRQLDNPGEPAREKLVNDYLFLAYAYQLLDSHRLVVFDICQELSHPALFTGGTSKRVVSDILNLVNKHTESPWAFMNANRMMTKKEWIKKILDMLKFRYLAIFEQGMLEQHRSLLIENMKCHPSQIQSFEKLSLDLLRKLLNQELTNPTDVLRPFTSEVPIRCYINGEEVKPATHKQRERYDAFLTTFGQLFGQPDMFIYLDQQTATLTFRHKETRMDKDYPVAYQKLWQLAEVEKEILKAIFDKRYGRGLFDKAFKYFKACQNLLGHEVLYHFTSALLLARDEKLKRGAFDTTPVKSTARFSKDEFTIKVNGSKCEISVVRCDGLLNTEALIRQAYTIVFDVKEDTIIPPSREMLSMSIECPT
jgi:hypothetical protein